MRPSVFVVDGQTDIPFTRLGRTRRRQPCSAGQLGLGFLLLLLAAGLAVQGWFLLQLYWRLEDMVTPLPVSGAWGHVAGVEGVSCVTVCLPACMCRTGVALKAAESKLIHLSEPQSAHL